jgi:molecular chaperone DnaK (HSP70)
VSLRLGIDFGTTRTVVAWCDRGNYPVVSFADESGDSIECYPSIVAEREGELKFGYDASHCLADPSWTVLRSFKRLLSGDVSAETAVTIGGTSLPIDELLTKFFSALRSALLTSSNISAAVRRNKRIDAMIAAPANSHSAQRFLSLDGFRQAGFEVLGLLNEPSAAGFEYTHRFRNTITSRRDHVLVYDIGGGTFDVSLLRMSGAHHEVVMSAGVSRLGGDDFDEILVELALERAGVTRGSLSRRGDQLLTDHCRDLKERLNPSSRKVGIDLASCLGTDAPAPEVVIDVGEYYERCAPLIQRTIDVALPLMDRAERDGDPMDAVGSDIAGVYVVGGASALPAVGRALRQQFGKRVHRSPYPSAAAAIGLAIAADENSAFELTDRFSRVFGVFREGRGGAEVTFDPIIGRDVPLPTGRAQTIVCERTYHAAHNVGHFRYVECSEIDGSGVPRGDIGHFADVFFPFDPSLKAKNIDLASVTVRRFDEQGPLVRETYGIDKSGIVEAKIRNLDHGYERSFRLPRSGG